MLDFNSAMIGSSDPEKLAEFYEKVFKKEADMQDEGWYGWQVGKSFFSIGEHSEVQGEAIEPQRIIFNFETPDVQEEFDRIKKLGARVVKEPYEMDGFWIATFADPDGNYFQLMSPWESEKN